MANSKAKKDISNWQLYPDVLPGGRFSGYYTKDEPSQVRGVFPVGQNVIFTDSRTPTTRDGYDLVGTTESTNTTPIKRAWVFERRDGTEIEMRTYDDELEFRIQGVMTDFEKLKDGFTAGLEFAYGVISRSSLTVSYVQFCNGTDSIFRWTGVYGLYASDDTVNQITLQGSVTLANLGFTTTGTIIIGGVEITYTGITGQTFTGCSAVPSGPEVGDVITQSPITTGFTSAIEYSVALAHDGRIHTRQEIKKSVWNFSKLDDPFDWSTGSTDGDGNAKEVEQGGPITAFARDEKTIYCFKKRQIKTLQFKSNANRVDVPVYGTLKPADDKSSTVGALGQRSTFHGPNAVFFVTEDKELLELKRDQNIDYPQMNSISDPIRPTFQTGVHTDATGIVYNSQLYYAYKQDINSSYNDTVLIFDLIDRFWYPPIVGWNVADWTIINQKLHWHSSTSPNTYEVITDKTDMTLGYTSTLRTWSETFGEPHLQKKVGRVWLEIYMTENTKVTATVLYDEDGFTGQEEFELDATEDLNNKFDSQNYNVFGASSFGSERFGSNPDISGAKKYRYEIELKNNIEFYNIALQLSSENAGDNWELIRFGWFITNVIPLTPQKYLKGT